MANDKPIPMIPFFEFEQLPDSLQGYEAAKKELMDAIKTPSPSFMTSLEQVLNELVSSSQFIDSLSYERILGLLSSYAGEGIAWSNLDVKTGSREELGKYKQQYDVLKQDLLQKQLTFEQKINIRQEMKAIKAKEMTVTYNKQFNKLKGDLFEAFLQLTIPLIAKSLNEATDINVDSLMSMLSIAIGTYEVNGKKIKTQGNENRPIHVQVETEDNGVIKWSVSSQGKTDVTVIDDELPGLKNIGITAKNYKNLKSGLTLLSDKAGLTNVVSQWPLPLRQQTYFYNSLSIYDPIPEQIIHQGKVLMAIQSIAGTTREEMQAGVLIINIRDSNKGQRIKVCSVPALLKQTIDNIDKNYEFNFIPQIPWFSEKHKRNQKQFSEKVMNAKIGIKMAKESLGISLIMGSIQE